MDTNERNFLREFRYTSGDLTNPAKKNYVPLSERDPSDWEDKVEVLPSIGMQAQEGKDTGQMRWARQRMRRPRVT